PRDVDHVSREKQDAHGRFSGLGEGGLNRAQLGKRGEGRSREVLAYLELAKKVEAIVDRAEHRCRLIGKRVPVALGNRRGTRRGKEREVRLEYLLQSRVFVFEQVFGLWLQRSTSGLERELNGTCKLLELREARAELARGLIVAVELILPHCRPGL